MAFTALTFDKLTWSAGSHPLERKKLVAGSEALLLEFAPGFEDPNLCQRGHAIYVLDGELDIVLAEGTQRITAGNGGVLDAGTPHRSRNPGSTLVRLFIASF